MYNNGEFKKTLIGIRFCFEIFSNFIFENIYKQSGSMQLDSKVK